METRYTVGRVVGRLEDKVAQIKADDPSWSVTKTCVWRLIVDVLGMGQLAMPTTDTEFHAARIGQEVGVQYTEVSINTAMDVRLLFELPEELRNHA